MKKIYFLLMAAIVVIISVYLYIKVEQSPHSTRLLKVNKTALNFIALGDWGRRGHEQQKEVADQMSITAAKLGTDFLFQQAIIFMMAE